MKKIFVKIIFLGIVAAGPALLADLSEAQNNYLPQNEAFMVEFSPENPGPNASVTAQAISYTFDINRANIAWFLNGKKAGAGKMFSFRTGAIGSKTTVEALVTTYEGQKLNKSFSFQAAEVDLLWETATYVPYFYRGKALPSNRSVVKVTAFPFGLKLADSKLIYEWTLNDTKQTDQSGPAKKSFSFTSSRSGDDIVEINVSTPDGTITGTNRVEIVASQPKISFYEENALEGPLYQKELGDNLDINKPEFIVRAEPYFFSLKNLAGAAYEWMINDKIISTPQKPNLIRLTIPEGAKGYSTIKLSVQNQTNIFETAKKFLQANLNL